MTNPLIIDLSHHNTVTDFDAIRAGGTIGIIHKATEGTGYSDPEYWDRRAAAEDAGLLWASYHFLKHGDIEAQMQNFVAKVQPKPGERLVIDYEDDNCTLNDLHSSIDYLRKMAPDCEITVYSGHLIKDQLGNSKDAQLATTSLWLAQYTTGSPSWPKGTWPTWTLWQYSDAERASGISGAVDANRFNGSVDNACLWFDPNYGGDEVVPEPQPEADVVRIDITVPEGIAVVVCVNGEPLA